MKIGIIGTGVFSTSLALLCSSNKENTIIMWSENETLVNDFKKTKKLNGIFKDKTIPKNIKVTNSYEEALKDADLVFLMTSVKYLDSVCKDIKNSIHKNTPVCIGTKGITKENKKFVHELVHKHLKNKIAILSGPTFAFDVASLDPIGFTLACKDKKVCSLIKKAFDFDSVRIEISEDYKGVAICGCVKNIYAIGSGILSGLGYHESTNALYLTSVYEELLTILYTYKSSFETLIGLAGFGDLLLTCNSNKSRNFSYGEMIGKKKNKKTIEKFKNENTIEGIETLEVLYSTFKRKHIKCPIINCIYAIIYQEKDPKELISVITNKTTK